METAGQQNDECREISIMPAGLTNDKIVDQTWCIKQSPSVHGPFINYGRSMTLQDRITPARQTFLTATAD
jgi:hypothetical protein